MKPLFYFSALLAVLSPLFAQEVPIQTVKEGIVFEAEDNQARRYTGLVVSPSIISLMPRVTGEIIEVNFQDGGIVAKGQVLYRIDPVQYEAAAKAAEAEVAQVKAVLKYAESNYNRLRLLHECNAASTDSMENSLRAMQVGEANLLAAEAALITARDNLKNTVVYSPIDGTIGVTDFTVGNYVSPGSGVLAKVIQTDPIRVRFSISNRDFLSIFGSPAEFRKNASVRLRLADDSIYSEDGEPELVNNEANRNTDTLQLYAKFKNPEMKLTAGSSVTVTLSQKQPVKHPAVLPSAVMHDRDSMFVYVLDSANKIEKRVVQVGNATASAQFILSGLKPGERVVVDGTHKVRADETVNPVK